MEIKRTKLGLSIIKPDKYKDNRGYFFELFSQKNELTLGNFCQDNISYSTYKVLRGLHFQKSPYSQTKLIQVLSGQIYDVVVNIEKHSKDYGKWEANILDAGEQLFVPNYFAHGFQVMSNDALMLYKVTSFYSKEHEQTIVWDDADLNIKWPLENPIVSEKDRNGIKFKYL